MVSTSNVDCVKGCRALRQQFPAPVTIRWRIAGVKPPQVLQVLALSGGEQQAKFAEIAKAPIATAYRRRALRAQKGPEVRLV